MHQVIISLFIVCIILIIIYNTRFGTELKDKCNNTAGYFADAIYDMSRDTNIVYQETRGDFYDVKAKTVLKKLLAIPENRRTAMDNYKIGNIYRYHVKNPKLTHYYYQLSLEQLRNRPSTGTIQMVDRMGDYEIRNERIDHDIPEIRELIAEDLMLRQIEALGDIVQPQHGRNYDVNEIQNLRNAETHINPRHHRNTGHPRNRIIPSDVKILGDSNKDTYFKNMTKWSTGVNADTQNVHDSHLTDDVFRSYKKIVDGLPPLKDPQNIIEDFTNELVVMKNDKSISDLVHHKAMITINNMRDQHYSKIGDTERNILANVIRRINIPENLKNRKEMIISLATNLSNAVERNNITNMPVCISGRVASAISAPAHLDVDPDLGILKTQEAIRNEVFQSAHHEYKTTIKNALNGSNDVLKKGAEDVENGDDTPESQQLEEIIKENISNRLKKDFTGHISDTELNSLITQANMAF